MKATSLERIFIAPAADIEALRVHLRRSRSMDELYRALSEADFITAYDFLRSAAADFIDRGETDRAIDTMTGLDTQLTDGDKDIFDRRTLDLHAALMQILTALYIEKDDYEAARGCAATALTILASESKRKDDPFLIVLGSLLYDIAFISIRRKEYRQAERSLGKAVKIFERLAKTDPERFASTHLMAVNAAAAATHNRETQAELLSQYQEATSRYLRMVSDGISEATERLVESLAAEGDTLANMGRHREAVQYYSRALKTLTRIEPEFSLTQLRLSISLGESMLRVGGAMKEKGIHLLNTMLHKATKINAEAEHRAIVDILVNARSSKLDILSLWYKLFPR